nr:MAG TPA: hypothetical protein [Caudoviricetes sp.]
MKIFKILPFSSLFIPFFLLYNVNIRKFKTNKLRLLVKKSK